MQKLIDVLKLTSNTRHLINIQSDLEKFRVLVQTCFWLNSKTTFPLRKFYPIFCPIFYPNVRWSCVTRIRTNSHGATSSHISLYVFFFNSKTTANISKWYHFLFPLTHSMLAMLLSYFWDICIYIGYMF